MAGTPTEPTVLIVGAGTFGTSLAFHLAQQYHEPSRITVLDRTTSPPEPAASNDINKIIRSDYSSPFYCQLASEAQQAWATWSELRPYYYRTGWVMLDEKGSDLSERIRTVFRDRGHDPTEDVPLHELATRWKGILKGTDTDGFQDAYWNPEAGWCNAAQATANMMKTALERGCRYATGEVAELRLIDGQIKGARLTNGDDLTADQVVLATGAWTSNLLSPIEDALDVPDRDRIEHQVQAAGVSVAHYKMSDDEMEKLSEMPVVVYGEHGEVIPPPKHNRLLKYTNALSFTNMVTTKSGHQISMPPERDQHIVPTKLKQEAEATMMSRVMPEFAANRKPDHWRLCWDSYTPTQDWLLCRHPHSQLSNLFLAVGGSFHSYKFLPTAGIYACNVLSGKGNGAEKDRAWGWKSVDAEWRGAHEGTKPKRDLKDLEDRESAPSSKL